MKQTSKNWLILWSLVFMLSSIPILNYWLKNHYQVTIQNLPLSLVITLFTSGLISLIFLKIFNKIRFPGLVGAVFATTFLVLEYPFFRNQVFYFLKIKNLNGIIANLVYIFTIIVITLLIGFFLKKLITLKKWPTKIFDQAIMLTILVAFLYQLLSTGWVIIFEWRQFFYKPARLSNNTKSNNNQPKPDIYYLIFDRYTNQEVLKTQFNFDNADIIKFLTDNNFYLDSNAKSNYPYTTMSIASTLKADYHQDLISKFSQSHYQTIEPYHQTVRQSSVIKKLKEEGYTYYHLGTWYDATNQAPLADQRFSPEAQLTFFGKTLLLDNFEMNILSKTVYWPFILSGVKIGNFTIAQLETINEADATLQKLALLKKLANQPTNQRFIFAHILAPHNSYYFNADGSWAKNTDSNNQGEPLKQKYLNQINFINSQIKDLVNLINQKSNHQTIIIIQSDEGPYPYIINQKLNSVAIDRELIKGDMNKWPDQDLQMKFGILAAYFLPGANPTDLKNYADSVNIFRYIFNTYFGEHLPNLPKCYFALPKGEEKSFNYSDITQRLTGTENPACQKELNQ